MVRQCQVCKKLDYLNPEVSFHRLPTNPERRKLWFSIVAFEEDKQLPKHTEICSDHFSPRDIHTNANGLRYINSDANPELHTAVFVEPSSDSSETTLYDIPPEKSLGYSLDTIEEGNILDRPSSSNSATANLLNLPPTSSSATLTASEAEEKLLRVSQDISTTKNLEFQTKSRVPASKKRKQGYIGDMSSSDFLTPEKRSKNLKAVKTTLTNQQRRIHNLQMSVRRLRLKITSLKSVLDYMKEKCLILETSESTIRPHNQKVDMEKLKQEKQSYKKKIKEGIPVTKTLENKQIDEINMLLTDKLVKARKEVAQTRMKRECHAMNLTRNKRPNE